MSTKYCLCGKANERSASFCCKCGKPFNESKAAVVEKPVPLRKETHVKRAPKPEIEEEIDETSDGPSLTSFPKLSSLAVEIETDAPTKVSLDSLLQNQK